MSYAAQILAEILCILVMSILIIMFISRFRLNWLVFLGLFPIFLFSAGFALRLGSSGELIDMGFYFTEISYLFVYVIFTLCLAFGQAKYWGLGRK